MVPVMENITLWHERDISHSSVERIIFPDAFIVLDYSVHRMADVVKNLKVDKARMKENLEQSKRNILSSKLLLKLIDKNMSRKNAYSLVQKYIVDSNTSKGKHGSNLKILGKVDFEKYKKDIKSMSSKIIKNLSV